MESESAHIYKRDLAMVKDIVKKNILSKDPRMFFDPVIDTDPRGIINVTTDTDFIHLKLQDVKTGEILFETKGRTARELLYKIKHFHLISSIDHSIFIGSELAKAEICIKLGVLYKYDNPIQLSTGKIIAS